MGTIAAQSDNGLDVTGVDWNARILPVRVLGKCKGDDIDAADGIAWAGGVAVPNAPPNANPAHVINLSLGDPGPCPQFLQDAIDAAFARGVTRAIVAAAGNQASAASHFPSSCAGVLAIGASTFGGNRAGYSNFGARVDLMAPGGNGVACSAYNFLALDNTGATVPVADSTSSRSGTSFSAPLVSGVVSLMLSVAPDLTAAQVRAILKASAKPFPAGSTCNTTICGAGLLDAPGAVRGALAAAGAPTQVTLVEFYHAAFDHYFITWMPAEIAILDAGTPIKGWTRTGNRSRPTRPRRPALRRYAATTFRRGWAIRTSSVAAPRSARHGAEEPELRAGGPELHAPVPARRRRVPGGHDPGVPVFSNRPDANHRYMIDKAVRDQMVAKGWLAEGDGPDLVVMCAPQ